MSTSRCLILVSSVDTQRIQNVRMIEAYCTTHKIGYTEVDGADPANKEIRTSLFGLAERNGSSRQYPLFFAMNADRTLTFLGDLEKVQDLMDADDTDPALLAQYPDVPTFKRFFYPVKWSCL
ncbi:hypothetical protein WA588_005059, partial [Blastocystis sp. NMH]